MKSLTLEQLLQLHVLAIRQSGGSDGIRDIGRLEAAVATQLQEVFGEELYKEIFEKAAALCRGIIADHPFIDGNKRSGMLVGITFLEINGYILKVPKGDLEDFAVHIAIEHLDIPAIAAWFEKFAVKQ
jgi:death-on-curing protein